MLITNQVLLRLGWNSYYQSQLEKLTSKHASHEEDNAFEIPARVIGVRKNSFRIADGNSERLVSLAGRLMHENSGIFPVAGDWVLVRDTLIHHVFPRKNVLSRGAAGSRGKIDTAPTKAQEIAANLDAVFIVCGLDRDFNLRRIERYLTLIYNCGLTPVIVLTKADLHPDPEIYAADVESVAFGVPVHLVSSHDHTGINGLLPYLSPGKTIALIGSSGAGKSTLANRLFGEQIQPTATVSESVSKGRHTTTSRDLIQLPCGGMVIDNPGIREIAFWNDDDGVGTTFPEIEAMADQCRFSDCNHGDEPGCAVMQAVKKGELSQERLESFRKMQRELSYLSDRQHKSADRIEKERWKEVSLKIKAINKMKRRT